MCWQRQVRGFGLAGLLAVSSAACSEPRQDILLIVTDTVRADRVSAYGYWRHTTPQIDALARAGTLFEDVTAPSCWTLPSHASLFTGEPPWVHGAHRVAPGESGGVSVNGWHVRKMRDDLPTLAERLRGLGYRTVSLSANPWFSYDIGLARGFEKSETFAESRRLAVAAIEEITRPRDEPLFLFMNFMDAHSPYLDGPPPWSAPPEDLAEDTAAEWLRPYLMQRVSGVDLTGAERKLPSAALRLAMGELEIPREGFALLGTLYDAGLAGADFVLHQVIPAWAEVSPSSAIIVTSDHGEALGDHGSLDHHFSVYPEVLRVPLVIAAPGRLPVGQRVETPVQLQDVHDTVLDLAGVADAPRSLLRLAEREASEPLPVAAAVWPEAGMARRLGGRYAQVLHLYREGSDALVLAADGAELYDLRSDPLMQVDVAMRRPERVTALRARALEHFGEAAAGEPVQVDAATAERLRSLGYVAD
ncbi:MAG: sulfatase [Deltaproteobacteria bacterium]|nr:sulfatase [Deltaproteobacteria bacterium]